MNTQLWFALSVLCAIEKVCRQFLQMQNFLLSLPPLLPPGLRRKDCNFHFCLPPTQLISFRSIAKLNKRKRKTRRIFLFRTRLQKNEKGIGKEFPTYFNFPVFLQFLLVCLFGFEKFSRLRLVFWMKWREKPEKLFGNYALLFQNLIF